MLKFSIQTKALADILSVLKRVAPTRTTMPALDFARVVSEDGKIIMTAYDGDMVVILTAGGGDSFVEVVSEGQVSVPVRLLSELVGTVQSTRVTVGQSADRQIRITWDGGQAELPMWDPLSYPEIPALEEERREFSIGGSPLVDALNATVYAVSVEPQRPIFTGVCFECGGDGITLVSSDTRRMAYCTVACDANPGLKDSSFILPLPSANILRDILRGKELVNVSFSGKDVLFCSEGLTFRSRTICGSFPAWKRVIPAETPGVLTVSRKDMLSAIRRVSTCSDSSKNTVVLHLVPNLMGATLELSASNFAYGLAGKEQMDVDYTGPDLVIGFQSWHLVDVLARLNTDKVRFGFCDPRKACVVSPLPGEGEPGLVPEAVLMPVVVT